MTDVARFAAEPAITTSTYTRVSPYLGIITPTTQSMIMDKKDTQAGLVDGASDYFLSNSTRSVLSAPRFPESQSGLTADIKPHCITAALKNESQIQPGQRNTSPRFGGSWLSASAISTSRNCNCPQEHSNDRGIGATAKGQQHHENYLQQVENQITPQLDSSTGEFNEKWAEKISRCFDPREE
ncbi:hypothetical protein B0H11DRAFT_1920439 [Mycena galericulata]|nr:hypothetical protein B0H11DRAFT_1920439 [Mycena galericulata]